MNCNKEFISFLISSFLDNSEELWPILQNAELIAHLCDLKDQKEIILKITEVGRDILLIRSASQVGAAVSHGSSIGPKL